MTPDKTNTTSSSDNDATRDLSARFGLPDVPVGWNRIIFGTNRDSFGCWHAMAVTPDGEKFIDPQAYLTDDEALEHATAWRDLLAWDAEADGRVFSTGEAAIVTGVPA